MTRILFLALFLLGCSNPPPDERVYLIQEETWGIGRIAYINEEYNVIAFVPSSATADLADEGKVIQWRILRRVE